MTSKEDALFLTWLLRECGYRNATPLPDGRYIAIMPLMFTHAIVVARMHDRLGYDDRWCYSNYNAALEALQQWDGNGEPVGWHRHPGSGRRRVDGNEALEHIAP